MHDERRAKAIDTYWICTAEHGLNASTFTARVAASTGADCAASLSAAVGALSGPLHGGAPAYVIPMIQEAGESGDPEKWVREQVAAKKRIMGFGHRVYRAEDPRSRILKRVAKELGSPHIAMAEELEAAALKVLQERSPDRVLATNVEYYSAVVLDIAQVPPPLAPAMFGCSRVGGWSAHILEQKRTGQAHPSVGRLRRPAGTLAVGRFMTLAEAAAEADALAQRGAERELAALRTEWQDELEGAARSTDFRERAVALQGDRPVPVPAEAGAPRAAGSRTSPPPVAARRSSRSSCSRATIRARSTRSARRSTSSSTPIRRWRCAGSRSSACATGRRAATRSGILQGIAENDEADKEVTRPRPPSSRR